MINENITVLKYFEKKLDAMRTTKSADEKIPELPIDNTEIIKTKIAGINDLINRILDFFFGREMYKRANKILRKMNDKYGKRSVIAVQIITSPSIGKKNVSSSIDSFLKSLDQIMSWDWEGAKIVIEHCDRFIPSQSFEKGFMSIEDEVKALSKISSNYDIGITINWARSAIEGRSPNMPIEHLEIAFKNNLLSGLIFSGTSNNDELYGEWKDTHMPFAQSYNSEYYENNSLLTLDNIKQTLACIDIKKLDYLGVKLLSMPIDRPDIDRRVGVNLDAISILNQAQL